MPDGYDKNWVRFCGAIEGFRVRHQSWPTKIRMSYGIINDFRENLFTAESFDKIEAKLRLVGDDAFIIVAEDDAGRKYSYGDEGFPETRPDIDAHEWLGVHPDRAPHREDFWLR